MPGLEFSQITGHNIIWIEIPGDMHGNYLCTELKNNMKQTWKSLEDRFVESFLTDYPDIKIKRVDLFDPAPRSGRQVVTSSLIRLEIESRVDICTGIESHTAPIRWTPFQRNATVDKGVVENLAEGPQGFWDRECLGQFERRVCNETKRYLLRHVDKWIEDVADDEAPFLLLYIHFNATIGPLKSSSAMFCGGYSRTYGIGLSVRYASVSAYEFALQRTTSPDKIAVARSRTICCKSEASASIDYICSKPTKSAGKVIPMKSAPS